MAKNMYYSKKKITVKEREYQGNNGECTTVPDYVVRYDKFLNTYDIGDAPSEYYPKADWRLLSEVDENLIIVTAWGAKAVCLKGSYIVTYNALENDYNTLEKGAFESTYTKEDGISKSLKVLYDIILLYREFFDILMEELYENNCNYWW